MPPSSSSWKPDSTRPHLSRRLLRASLLGLFVAGGTSVLVALILPWLPWGRWNGELFAAGSLAALLGPLLGVLLEASLEETERTDAGDQD